MKDRYEGCKVLHQDVRCSLGISILARLQKDVAGEIVLDDRDILMASAGLSDIEEIEVQ